MLEKGNLLWFFFLPSAKSWEVGELSYERFRNCQHPSIQVDALRLLIIGLSYHYSPTSIEIPNTS